MGIGGDLMWTALANELYEKNGKKVCFYKNSNHVLKKDIWENNPNIVFNFDKSKYNVVNLQFSVLPERETNSKWKVSKHSIVSRCEHFNVLNPKIKCYLYFTDEEIKYVESIVNELPKDFIVIEPHAKTSWYKHKQYPIQKWQNIVDNLHEKFPIVQMSIKGKKTLNNVIDISNKIRNFREAACLIKYSKLFVSTEGGLMHASNAVNTKSVIIFPAMFDPIFTTYDTVSDIWVKGDSHYNCFRDGDCLECRKLMSEHDENEIIKEVEKVYLNN